MTSRVFILEKIDGYNSANAEDFGRVVYLFERGVRDRNTSIWQNGFKDEILDTLEDYCYDPEQDYFAVSGQTVPNQIVTTTLVGYYGQIKGLLFDSKTSKYREAILGDVVNA